MKNSELLSAFGMIRDEYITEAHEAPKRPRVKWIVALAVAAALLLTAGIPTALTAAGSERAYDLLYRAAPAVAQRLKPVKTSCEDSGIRLEAVSVRRGSGQAEIELRMTDLEGGRLNGRVVPVGDGTGIVHTGFDSWSGCGAPQDAPDGGDDEAAATVLILMPDGSNVPEEKVTITATRLMTAEEQGSFDTGVDVASLFRKTAVKNAGEVGKYVWDPAGAPTDGTVGADESGMIFDTGRGAAVISSCVYDSRLQIKIRCDDFVHTRNRGSVRFENADGECIFADQTITFDDARLGCRYDELIFDVTPEQLEGYTMRFDTVTRQTVAEGFWRITVPIKPLDPIE